MATTTRYVSAEVALSKSIKSSDNPISQEESPRHMKWPTVNKVLKTTKYGSECGFSSLRLELQTHDFQSHLAPLYQCFNDKDSFVKLLNELSRKDSDLSTYLEAHVQDSRQANLVSSLEEDDAVDLSSQQPTISIEGYVDFVSAFVSLFVQSRFIDDYAEVTADEDPHEVISTLAQLRCPENIFIFRRVCVSPHLVVKNISEGDTPELYNGIPVNHLAKFVDVAVVHFLSTVTEHTSPKAVEWTVDYLIKLLNSLQVSLTSLNSLGWYGAPPSRTRKGTTTSRPSITHPLMVPPMVVVGTPPTSPSANFCTISSFADPVTGQRSPIITSPSHGISTSSSVLDNSLLSSLAQISKEFPSPAHTSARSPFSANADGDDAKQKITQSRNPAAPHHVPMSDGGSCSPEMQHPLLASHSPFTSKHVLSSSPPFSDNLGNGVKEKTIFPMDPTESDYFESVKKEVGLPVLVKEQSPDPKLHNGRGVQSVGPTESKVRALHEVSPPTLVSIQEDSEVVDGLVLRQDKSASPEVISPPEASCVSPTYDEEVRSKVKSSNIPQVDIEKEMSTLMNVEGRISLIAILHAIAKLPQSEVLWTTQFGNKCLSLIQVCLDLGLPPMHSDIARSKPGVSDRRKKFQKKDNAAFTDHGSERPSVTHVRYIVEKSINALIQCATSLMVGCTTETHLCPLRHTHVSNYESRSFHSKIVRLLQRINDRSTATFRQSLTTFAQSSGSSARSLFQFLHVMLQYCSQSTKTNNLVVDIVVSVLRTVVDRLVELDITEQSIQTTIISEACTFFQFAQSALSDVSLSQIWGSQHLKMYFHRIALSVILPPRLKASQMPLGSPLKGAASSLIARTVRDLDFDENSNYSSDTSASSNPISKPLKKQLSSSNLTSAKDESRRIGPVIRSGSLHLLSRADSSTSRSAKPGGGKGRRGPLKKQQSLHTDIDRQTSKQSTTSHTESESGSGTPFRQRFDGASNVSGETLDERQEWKGLQLDLLRSRIQRLVVLMDTCVPGTVPNPDMLASLIDLGDGKTVVARSMVFLECAMFVSKLRTQEFPSVWVTHNKDSNFQMMHSVSYNLKKWGDAIAEKLRLTELRGRELMNRFRFSGKDPSKGDSSGTSRTLIEEPVFPVDHKQPTDSKGKEGEMYQSVSYAIKMSACMLLLEITRFMRNPPPQFSATSGSQVGSPRVSSVVEPDRKPSTSSIVSSDEDSFKVGYSLPAKGYSSSTSNIGRFGSTLSVEEPDPPPTLRNILSVEEGGSPVYRKKRVSVYLRVSSTSGTMSRNNSLRRQPKAVRVTESSRGNLHSSPTVRTRRRTMIHSPAVAPLHTVGTRRPSVVAANPIPISYRRKSLGTTFFKQGLSLEADHHPAPPSDVAGASKTHGAGASLFGNSLNAGFTKLKRAFTKRLPTKPKAPTELGSSPSGSPGFRRKVASVGPRISQAGSFYSRPGSPEDRGLHCQWLKIVEHLIVVESSFPLNIRHRHSVSCKGLIIALKKVYSSVFKEDKDSTQRKTCLAPRQSVSALFSPKLALQLGVSEDVGSGGAVSYRRGLSLPDAITRRTSRKSMPFSSSKSLTFTSRGSSSALSAINFSQIKSTRFNNTFFGAMYEENEDNIALLMEAESAYPRSFLDAKQDNWKREYVMSELLGLVHVPFSILVHAAPILHHSTFSNLKGLAWDTLLDHDAELSQSAAAFFLVACSKENCTTVKGFVKEKVVKEVPAKQREAIHKFKVLWDARYQVWPRMEERAHKTLSLNDNEDNCKILGEEKVIGYSLPANLLGQPGDSLPLPPWETSSVCTNKTCGHNPNLCYRSTRHVPVIHADEVTDKVQDFNVTGISLAQEASSKPANVFYGIEADDDTGNVEKWEAVKTTLFPCSLCPLVHFVIMALVPPSFSPSSPPSSHPHASTATSSSHPHASTAVPNMDGGAQQTDICEVARQVVWTCMIEDDHLFFQPLLNHFNRLYMVISESRDSHNCAKVLENLLASILKPLHVLIQSFHRLPSQAAHYLFNNFIGIIMKHTDQPLVQSDRIIQSVLTLVGMIVPSVKGLDSKILKTLLKKESCYTNIMATARIRGVERVCVTDRSHMQLMTKPFIVSEDMTFADLIAQARNEDRVSLSLLNNWYIYDEAKDVPVLSSFIIQDHYSAPLDSKYLNFALKGAAHSEHLWTNQMDQMFVFKMSEMMRVLFTTQLIHTGPEVEKGVAYSEYAQPNHRFIHNELVELNSFPRKALTSILQEAGKGGLQHAYLHASDIMLKGTWVQFILQLFKSVKPDYNWSNSIVLFLNVINGVLLLYCENHSILRFSLAALLVATSKFKSVFKRDGYQIILPTLFQVYALHIQDRLITNALKFVWLHFYLLDGNVFISQVAASASILFSEPVASLSSKVSSNYVTLSSSLVHSQREEVKRFQVKAVFELTCTLDMSSPKDELDIMLCCQQCLDEANFAKLNSDNHQRLSLETSAALLITLATWMPGALRGMQVLVCIDHIMPYFLKSFIATNPQSVLKSMEYLIKGCESITRPQSWRENISSRKGAKGGNSSSVPANITKPFELTDTGDSGGPGEHKKPSGVRKVSVVFQQKFRRLINPNKKEEQGSELNIRDTELQRPETPAARSLAHGIDYGVISNQFKLRRLQYENQQVLQLARDSLLSISSQYVSHYSKACYNEVSVPKGTIATATRKISNNLLSSSKIALDASSIAVLTSIAIQLIKHGYTNVNILREKGLRDFMTCLLPTVEWSEPYFPSFQALLNRLVKFFKYLQKDSNRAMMIWDCLTMFITCITKVMHVSPQLIQGQEQHLQKLKTLLEAIVNLQYSGVGSPTNQSSLAQKRIKSIQVPLIQSAPVSFSEAVVSLATELIVLTHTFPQQKLRYHMCDLLYHKIIKEHEGILMAKIVLPLCTKLGLRDDIARPCLRDAEFILDYVDSIVEFVLKLKNPKIINQKLPPDTFFRALTVICCSFSETFSVRHWHKISQWVISLTQRKSLLPVSSKISISSSESDASSRSKVLRVPSISSPSGLAGSSVSSLESFLIFHECLLEFFESFLVVFQVPLMSMLWSVLKLQESQLLVALEEVKSDVPVQFEKVTECIERCQKLLSSAFNPSASVSKHQLLHKLHEDLRQLSLPTRSLMHRSKTTSSGERPHPLKLKKPRRNSNTVFTADLPNIGEEASDMEINKKIATLPKRLKLSQKPDHRPKSLGLKHINSPKVYTPPPVRTSVKTSSLNTEEKVSTKTHSPRRKKRSPSPRRSPSSSSAASTPYSGSSHTKKVGRNPVLRVIGRFGSSECHADIEDAEDVVSPEKDIFRVSKHDQILAATNPVLDDLDCLSAEHSYYTSKRETSASEHPQSRLTPGIAQDSRVLVVPIEVYEDSETHFQDNSPLKQISSLEGERNNLYSINSNDSTNSETNLLQLESVPSVDVVGVVPGASDKDTNVVFGAPAPTRKSSLSTMPRRNSRQERTRKVSFSDDPKMSLSIDRKTSFMSSALQESSQFIYTSLDDSGNT